MTITLTSYLAFTSGSVPRDQALSHVSGSSPFTTAMYNAWSIKAIKRTKQLHDSNCGYIVENYDFGYKDKIFMQIYAEKSSDFFCIYGYLKCQILIITIMNIIRWEWIHRTRTGWHKKSAILRICIAESVQSKEWWELVCERNRWFSGLLFAD